MTAGRSHPPGPLAVDRVAALAAAEEDRAACASTSRGRPVERIDVPPPAGDPTWGTLRDAIGLEHAAQAAAEGPDMVNHPPHYTAGDAACPGCGEPIQCIEVVRHMTFDRGNAVKYVWRAGKKGDAAQEIEDLRKARWYLADEIKRLGGEP